MVFLTVGDLVTTEPEVIDRILSHVRPTGGRDPFEGRAPPETSAQVAGTTGWMERSKRRVRWARAP